MPFAWQAPTYGARTQDAIPDDDTCTLDPKTINRTQQIVGTLLYYARAVDPTMLVALGTLAEEQTKGNPKTLAAVHQLLDYAATHPNAQLTYKASNMTLHIDSDASYLSLPKACSRAGGFFYLSSASVPQTKAPKHPPINGAIHVLSHKMRHVLASAAEAKIGALFENGQEAAALRTILSDMGHPQGPTPIKTDNSTAYGITNSTVKQKRSRAMDMRFYWVRDRVQQGQFQVYWQPGSDNLADYFTKHHPTSHHRKIQDVYLQPNLHISKSESSSSSSPLQGCIKPTKVRPISQPANDSQPLLYTHNGQTATQYTRLDVDKRALQCSLIY